MKNDAPQLTLRLALSVAEAADAISLSTRSVWSLVASGSIPHVRINRRVLIPVDGLRKWLEEQSTKTLNDFATSERSI